MGIHGKKTEPERFNEMESFAGQLCCCSISNILLVLCPMWSLELDEITIV